MATTADLKKKSIIELNNDYYFVLNFQHVKPGKGGAFVRTELKNLTTGRVLKNTFNAGANIVFAPIKKQNYQFLYKDNDIYYFMNEETFEEIEVEEKKIPNVLLLKEGQRISILYHEDKKQMLGIEFPQKIDVKIVDTEETCKGNSVSQEMKKAKTETGLEIMVPIFIKKGDIVKINTEDCSYIEKTNKNISA